MARERVPVLDVVRHLLDAADLCADHDGVVDGVLPRLPPRTRLRSAPRSPLLLARALTPTPTPTPTHTQPATDTQPHIRTRTRTR
eukprot:542254-Rhodomonas_salina.1